MAFCLIPSAVERFKKALKSKAITVESLLNLSPEQRIELFKEYAGENAKDVNTLFEEKLVLKNKVLGIKNWASKLGQFGRYDPARKAELDKLASEYKAAQQARIFNPQQDETYLAGLVEKQLGVGISREEAKAIFEMRAMADKLFEKYDEEAEQWPSVFDKIQYGAAEVVLKNYVNALKLGEVGFKETVQRRFAQAKADYAENPAKAVYNVFLDALKAVSENSIVMVASLDNSFLGRQGIKTLMTHPSSWVEGALNSFADIVKVLGGKDAMDALLADIYSRPNYINGNYQTAGIVSDREEEYPTTLPERIPFMGRLYKASEVAFKGSALRMRTDMFDLLYVRNEAKQEARGKEMDKQQVEALGTLINSLTARGQFGRVGESPIVKLLLWSPRMLKANYDVLTAHTGGAGLQSAFARQEARKNLLKIVSVTALLMMIARATNPDDPDKAAEINPLSSAFGKIYGFDITGGAASLITLAARLVMNSSKNATTGITTRFGTGFADRTRWDAVVDFLAGKTAPITSLVIQWLKGETYEGKPPTVVSTAKDLTIPISIQNVLDLKDNNSVGTMLGLLTDLFGLPYTEYGSRTDWSASTGKELLQFKKKAGDKVFQQANDEFNQKVDDWLTSVKQDPKFQNLSTEDKQTVITNKKSDIKESIFVKYKFFYIPEFKAPAPRF